MPLMCREETSRYWWTESPARVSVLLPERKRVETVPGNSLRTAPYSVKGAKGVEEVPGTWRKPRHTTKGRDDDNRGNENFRTPYTNRGVTRQKEDLTALIDWCQITVKGVDVFIIIEDILRIPLSFMELHGKEKGIAGHD